MSRQLRRRSHARLTRGAPALGPLPYPLPHLVELEVREEPFLVSLIELTQPHTSHGYASTGDQDLTQGPGQQQCRPVIAQFLQLLRLIVPAKVRTRHDDTSEEIVRAL